MDSSIWFGLVLPVLIALAVASRGFRMDEEYVARWAGSAGLELTAESQPVVRRYLTWSSRSRTVGGLVGFLAPVVYTWVAQEAFDLEATPRSDTGGVSVVLMFAGYLLGALFAELVINRPGPRAGTALPGSSRLRDYLSHYLLVIQRSLGITSAALVGAYAILAPLVSRPRPSLGAVAIFGFVAVVVAAVIEALQRIIIGRRHTAISEEEQAVDDAMRSSSVHVVAGAGVALLIFFTTILITGLLILIDTPQGLASFALMLFLFPLSIFFWLDSGKPHGFRVRRNRSSTLEMKGEMS